LNQIAGSRMTTREQILKRLPFIFPVGTPHRKFCISEVAAGAIYTILRKGVVNPKHIFRMNEGEPSQTLLRRRPLALTLTRGLIPSGAVKILPGVHPNVFKPKYYLEKEFAFLVAGPLHFSDLHRWQKKHFDPETLSRIARIRKAVRRLTPRQKKVFLTTRYENRLRKEAAAQLGLTLPIINNDLRSAMSLICKHVRNARVK
jgi:hypothetical protein